MNTNDTTGTPDTTQITADSQVQETPTPIELTDDAYVKLPGSEKPVKYGEWFRDFQSKHTKATMERSQFQKELDRIKREREAEQAELARYRQAQNPQQKQDRRPKFDDLRSRPYLSGEEAAQTLESVYGQFEQALATRDQALKLLVQKIQQQDQILNGLNTDYSQNQFRSKIKGFVSQLGLPEEAEDLAAEIYLAYEGDNLDQEFPEILKQRWDKIVNLARSMDRKKVEQTRSRGFIPGKGPVGSTGKPLDMSKMSAKESADALWDSLQGSDT